MKRSVFGCCMHPARRLTLNAQVTQQERCWDHTDKTGASYPAAASKPLMTKRGDPRRRPTRPDSIVRSASPGPTRFGDHDRIATAVRMSGCPWPNHLIDAYFLRARRLGDHRRIDRRAVVTPTESCQHTDLNQGDRRPAAERPGFRQSGLSRARRTSGELVRPDQEPRRRIRRGRLERPQRQRHGQRDRRQGQHRGRTGDAASARGRTGISTSARSASRRQTAAARAPPLRRSPSRAPTKCMARCTCSTATKRSTRTTISPSRAAIRQVALFPPAVRRLVRRSYPERQGFHLLYPGARARIDQHHYGSKRLQRVDPGKAAGGAAIGDDPHPLLRLALQRPPRPSLQRQARDVRELYRSAEQRSE